jgi:hypothetical protein
MALGFSFLGLFSGDLLCSGILTVGTVIVSEK